MNTRILSELIERNDINDMFKLVYQPYVDLSTQTFVGAEALLRCTHPSCANLSILDIITMLERSGNIEAISKCVFKVATAQLKEWRESKGLSDQFTMSANVSAALLRNDNFVQAILDIIEDSEIPGSSLMIEITETTVMEDYARSRQAMHQLNEVGIEFAMDDFGTGYSSFVDASVRLGHAIEMTVIAEGIETAEQAAQLQKLGCERGQGYYYSMLLPPDERDLTQLQRKFAA